MPPDMLSPRQSHLSKCLTSLVYQPLQWYLKYLNQLLNFFRCAACGTRHAAQGFNLSSNSCRFRTLNRYATLQNIPQWKKICFF